MAERYARIENDTVIALHLVAQTIVDEGGEIAGAELLTNLHGGQWVRYSKTGEFRVHTPGIGFTYDGERDAFIPPKPFESWVLDEGTCLWVAPLPYPDDEGTYSWNEELFVWELVADE
jgi:hypothetical protein